MSRTNPRRLTAPGPAALLATAMLTASLGQMVLGALAPLLRAELGISTGEIGLLGTAMFGAAAVWSVVAGRLTDRFGGRSQLVLLYLLVASSLALLAAANGRAPLYLSMLLGGLALASQNPATNQLIARHAAPAAQPRLLATKQTGAQLAGAVAGVLPVVAVVTGWRAPLAVLAAVSAGLALLSRILLPQPSRMPEPRSTDSFPSTSSIQRPLTLYAVLMGTGVGAAVAYLPLYVHDDLAVSPNIAGSVLAYLAIVGALTLFAWVRVAARSADPELVLAVMAALAALAVVLVWAASHTSVLLLWLGLALLGATYTTWLAVAMLAVVRARPHHGSGQLSGVILLGFFVGMTAGPAAFGQLAERTGYGPSLAAIAALFALGSAVTLLAYRRTTKGQRARASVGEQP